MGLSSVFDITGTALNAQSIHIDTIAKNMANAQVLAGSEQTAYRARRPNFSSILESNMNFSFSKASGGGVTVEGMSYSDTPIEKQMMRENPFADDQGYVYLSNVNLVEEMAYMMEASRNYQSNIEVMNTSKQLMQRTISLGA
ncbi:MAG: flagellar basal-body rod protein FlgC [Pseudohongiella sp.]|nr:MAG: flagellar basal-body rod protein FlgC [Pseudohongiella sp.]